MDKTAHKTLLRQMENPSMSCLWGCQNNPPPVSTNQHPGIVYDALRPGAVVQMGYGVSPVGGKSAGAAVGLRALLLLSN